MDISKIAEAFKAEHPDAYKAIFTGGAESATATIDAAKNAARAEGVEAEKARAAADGAVVFAAVDFIAAFGDKGARWFCEKKPFAACSAEFIAAEQKSHSEAFEALKVAHKTATDARDGQIAELKTQLANAPRGNDPVSFSAEKPTGEKAAQSAEQARLERNMGANLAKVAANMKFAEQVVSPTPIKK